MKAFKWFLVIFVFLAVPVSYGASLEWDESVGAIGYKVYTSPIDGPDPTAQPTAEANYTLWVTLYERDAAPVEIGEGEDVIDALVFPVPEGSFNGKVYFRATAFNHSGESSNDQGEVVFSNYAVGEFGPLDPPKNFILPLPE